MKIKQIIIGMALMFTPLAYSQTTITNTNRVAVSNETKVVKEDTSWTPLLDEYLQKGQFGKARELANSKPPSAVIERLRPWAKLGLTPAQWMYSEVLGNAGQQQESATWAYIAFFNTRFDAHLCKNGQAVNLEKSIVSSFNKTVTAARMDREIMSQAITETIDFLSNVGTSYISGKHPEWICYMVKNNSQEIFIPTDKWSPLYKNLLDKFIETTTPAGLKKQYEEEE